MADQSLLRSSLGDFLDRLASQAPTPGGGSAAALSGALAASLGQMVCALTAGKPKFAAVQPQVRVLADRLARAAAMFRSLIDEDAAAYELLSAALKLPRSDPERARRVAAAAALSGTVPLETVALSKQLLAELDELGRIGNPLLGSDVEAARHLATAALHAAAANVRANLPLMEAQQAQQTGQELEVLLRARSC